MSPTVAIYLNTADVIASLLANLVTIAFGIVGLVTFFRYRKKIPPFLRLLRLNHVNDRVAEVRKTLDLILASDTPKGKAAELRGLFGRLNGQLVPLVLVVPELCDLQRQVGGIAHDSGQLSEPIKQQIAHQIFAEIENSKMMSINEIVGGE